MNPRSVDDSLVPRFCNSRQAMVLLGSYVHVLIPQHFKHMQCILGMRSHPAVTFTDRLWAHPSLRHGDIAVNKTSPAYSVVLESGGLWKPFKNKISRKSRQL